MASQRSKPPPSPRQNRDVELVAGLLRTEKPKTRKNRGVKMGFHDIEREFMNSPHIGLLNDTDSDAIIGLGDLVAYRLENAIATNPNVRFFILIGLAVLLTLVCGGTWSSVTKTNGGAHEATSDMGGATFLMFQVLLTGGFDDNIEHLDQRFIFAVAVIGGITLISVLIGLITDTVNDYMEGLLSGTTKVVEKGHTLILGWNESTPRALVQIAFLRRVYHSQNDTWLRRLFPFLRTKPSSPVAAAPIVVMTDTKPKHDMEKFIKAAFAARNVGRRYTRVGHDVVFRKGDPCDTHDLVRVAAHQATSVLVMMTKVDNSESQEAGNSISNSATIRTVLALRTIIYSNGSDPSLTFNPALRVVVHLERPCKYLNAASFVAPGTNRQVLYSLDLLRSINSLMFYCASKPGLSRVLMALYDFDDEAFRCRKASELRAGSGGFMGMGRAGWFVGKTMATAMRDNGWRDGIVVGCGERDAHRLPRAAQAHGRSPLTAAEAARREAQIEAAGLGDGMVNDPDRVIAADDYIIFVSKTSAPTVAKNLTSDRRNWAALAKPFVAHASKRLRASKLREAALAAKPRHILVCGWRPEWDGDPDRFRGRIHEIGHGLSEGSVITCLNVKKAKDFDTLLESVTKSPRFVKLADVAQENEEDDGHNSSCWTLDDPMFSQCVQVRHYSADPTDYDAVGHLLDSSTFDTAICLGTVVGKVLSPAASDARVLSMLLVLRSLAKPGSGMHVIAENQQDQTSGLAVVPPNNGSAHEPDFINTQAIIARSLVMNLAYPQMQEALTDLLVHDVEDTPEVDFVTPQTLAVMNKKTYFGVVQRIVLDLFHSRAQCIGYFEGEGSKLSLNPPPGLKVTWTPKHRVIVIVRGGLHQQPSSRDSSPARSVKSRKSGRSSSPARSVNSRRSARDASPARSASSRTNARRSGSLDRPVREQDLDADDDSDEDDDSDDGNDSDSGDSGEFTSTFSDLTGARPLTPKSTVRAIKNSKR